MSEVFVLQHVHVFEEGGESVKMLGVYSSEFRAAEAMARYKMLPGFSDFPDLATPESDSGFYISSYMLRRRG